MHIYISDQLFQHRIVEKTSNRSLCIISLATSTLHIFVPTMALLRIATVVALSATYAFAQFNMLRFPCSQLVVERTDPLVFPGMTYTPHVHQIVGGDSFEVDMPIGDHDLPGLSTCTSCSYSQDKSNYWTAAMYFQHNNGSFHRARQVGNGGPQGSLNQDGGITMYYIPSGRVTAFAPVRPDLQGRDESC